MNDRLKDLPVRVAIRRYDGSHVGLTLEVFDERSRMPIVVVDIPKELGMDLLTGRDVEAVAEFVNDSPNLGRWAQNKTVYVPIECGYTDDAGMDIIRARAEEMANAGEDGPDRWVADSHNGYNHHKVKGTKGKDFTYEVTVRRHVGHPPAPATIDQRGIVGALADLQDLGRRIATPVGPEPEAKKGRRKR